MSTGVSLACSMCHNEFTCSIGYFRCNHQACNFDLCVRCAVTGVAGPKAPRVEQKSCLNGHTLSISATTLE